MKRVSEFLYKCQKCFCFYSVHSTPAKMRECFRSYCCAGREACREDYSVLFSERLVSERERAADAALPVLVLALACWPGAGQPGALLRRAAGQRDPGEGGPVRAAVGAGLRPRRAAGHHPLPRTPLPAQARRLRPPHRQAAAHLPHPSRPGEWHLGLHLDGHVDEHLGRRLGHLSTATCSKSQNCILAHSSYTVREFSFV